MEGDESLGECGERGGSADAELAEPLFEWRGEGGGPERRRQSRGGSGGGDKDGNISTGTGFPEVGSGAIEAFGAEPEYAVTRRAGAHQGGVPEQRESGFEIPERVGLDPRQEVKRCRLTIEGVAGLGHDVE